MPGIIVKDAFHVPLGYEKITGLSSVKTLTVPSGAKFAMIVPESKSVRFLDLAADGNPTSTNGQILAADTPFWYPGDLRSIKFIETAASATLHVTYYK